MMSERHARERFACYAASLLAIATACSDTEHTVLNTSTDQASKADISTFDSVSWIDSGTLLVQGDAPRRDWIVTRDTGRVVPLEAFEGQASTQASPDGTRLMRIDEDSLVTLEARGAIDGRPSTHRTDLPPFAGVEESLEVRNRTYGFWLNDGRILVVRTNFDASYEQCYIYDRDGTELLRIAMCMRDVPMAGSSAPSRVLPLGDDRYAAYSNDEGDVQITRFRYIPETSVKDADDRLRYPQFADVEIHRDETSDTIYLASRLPLNRDGGYAESRPDFPPSGPATLYRADPRAGFQATEQTIPYRGALRSIESGDLAWIEPQRSVLCTRSPGREPACAPLPAEIDVGDNW
jgi:hypothetical protein